MKIISFISRVFCLDFFKFSGLLCDTRTFLYIFPNRLDIKAVFFNSGIILNKICSLLNDFYKKNLCIFSFLLIVVNDFLVCKKEILILTIDGPTGSLKSGFCNQKSKRERKLNKTFLHFLPILMIFQSSTSPSVYTVLHFEKSSKMAKNEEKP